MPNFILEDSSNICLSVIHTTTISNYLKLVEQAFENKGGISGQRAPLKTKTAQRIRERMVSDIKHGALLPPIVIGIVLSEAEYQRAKQISCDEQLDEFIKELDAQNLSIIDGMQRTTALFEALEVAVDISNNQLRVEYWMSCSVNSLIYRMLILNTGQVPWDIKRQLSTVYSPILKEIKDKVPNVEIIGLDQSSRRTSSGEFQGSKLIEFFIAFSSRKPHTEIKEKITEDFERMNAADALADKSFIENFILMIEYLTKLDKAFESLSTKPLTDGKFKTGRDIFTSSPAGIGFMAAAAVVIYGLPGTHRDIEKTKTSVINLRENIESVLEKTENSTDPSKFLDLLSINEQIIRPSGKVGEFERDYFFRAFKTLFEYGKDLDSLTACWVAY
uniref:hypothetical protein n=1 Tax=Cellvibrio fontiphilus TaxID=1815559 RepID=UPI002B4BF3F4|nr:hypothetical protein [Cellvibrio fontiphilus]